MNIGLVGLGYWGLNYLRVLTQLDDVKLSYVCDKDINKHRLLKKVKSETKFTPNLVELVDNKFLDGIVVVTPASTHYDIVKLFLESGKHVLVEKPLTMSYDQALELDELSRDVGKVLMVGHIYCHNPAVNYIKSLLDRHRSGRFHYGIGLRMGLGPIRGDASCTWDLAAHDVAMLDYLLGKMPAYVSANATSFLQREKGIYDYATIQLRYKDGFQFSLTVSWYAAEKIRSWYLVGSDSMVKFDDMNKGAPITIYHRSTVVVPSEQAGEHNVVVSEGDTVIPHVPMEEPLLLEVEHFLKTVRDNKIKRPLTDGAQGARVVKVLEAVEGSIKRGGSPVSV